MGEGKEWDATHQQTLHEAATLLDNPDKFWTKSQELAREVSGGFSINDGKWGAELKAWLETNATKSITLSD